MSVKRRSIRRASAAAGVAILSCLAVPALAMAEAPPYQAPPVTPGTAAYTSVADPSVAAYNSVTDPASTGAGFSVGTLVAIGAVVLVAGLALVLTGNRIRKAGDH